MRTEFFCKVSRENYGKHKNILLESEISDSVFCILIPEQKFEGKCEGDKDMKGYTVESGYMGYVNGEYMLFASETDYVDYMEK